MRAIVLTKQVPDLRGAPIGVRPDGTIDREAAGAISNPADLHALEAALCMADDVWALSMGPPQAEAALREAVSLAATRAVLLCDRMLAGPPPYGRAASIGFGRPLNQASPPTADALERPAHAPLSAGCRALPVERRSGGDDDVDDP